MPVAHPHHRASTKTALLSDANNEADLTAGSGQGVNVIKRRCEPTPGLARHPSSRGDSGSVVVFVSATATAVPGRNNVTCMLGMSSASVAETEGQAKCQGPGGLNIGDGFEFLKIDAMDGSGAHTAFARGPADGFRPVAHSPQTLLDFDRFGLARHPWRPIKPSGGLDVETNPTVSSEPSPGRELRETNPTVSVSLAPAARSFTLI